MYHGYKLGIVVPAYNEAKLISDTLAGMPESADRIYVVDDGSTDNTLNIIERFNGGRFHLLTNGHNQGVGAAIAPGSQKCIGTIADLDNAPIRTSTSPTLTAVPPSPSRAARATSSASR